jgi:outer membrane lipoprotein LolB
MPLLGRLTLWLLPLVFAGCASMEQSTPTAADWATHSAQVAALQHWTASGKLAVRTQHASESASMVWRQQARNSKVHLSGPLGVGAITVESDGDQLHIYEGGEHRTIDISTPDAIFTHTGWDLPLQALSYWLKGVPSPATSLQALKLDPQTELVHSLTQDDWEVRYEKYQRFQDFTLPTRLLIQRGATRAKVIISQWQTVSS